MWLDNVIYEKRTIEGERLELKAQNENYYLAEGLILRQCTVVLKVPTKRLHLAGPKLIDCKLEVKKELKSLSWCSASLRGCTFTGRMGGNDFGRWPNGTGFDRYGEIEDCDFTASILDGCRFIGCDMRSIRLPRWPCFTLLEPYARRQELAAFDWPGRVGIAMYFSYGPETYRAVTFWAPSLVKGLDATEEELKAALLRLDGVVL